jgi:hypothetical protein
LPLLGGREDTLHGCPSGGWPPRALSARPTRLHFAVAGGGASLTRVDDGCRAALALAAAYGGERALVLGFGGVARVRDGAAGKLLQEAARLLQPWGREGRIELRSLRPAVRRTLFLAVAGRGDVELVAAARRAIVVAPVPDPREAEDGLGGNRRRMLLLAARDGEHCVWCGKPLSHRDADATVDHVRCRSVGGGNALENLVLACAACNHRRSDLPAEDWLARCLAADAAVDEAAVAAAIRRSARYHRQRVRRALAPAWSERAAA